MKLTDEERISLVVLQLEKAKVFLKQADEMFSNVFLLEGIPPLFPTGIPFWLSKHLLSCARNNLLVLYFLIDKKMFLRI